jgi:hypothetical protein
LLDGFVAELAEHGGGHESLGQRLHHQTAAQLLHDHHHIDRALAQAAILLGHGEGRQAQLGQLVPDLAREAALFGNALAALEGIALVHPAGHGIAQLLLVVGKIEIHICLLLPKRVREAHHHIQRSSI